MSKTNHHLYWPKRKWSHGGYRKHKVLVPAERHQDYHNHFLHNCRRKPLERRCLSEFCGYEDLCVYKDTIETF